MPFNPPENERGAALLTVLLLVAVMAVITATALDRLKLSTRLAANGSAMTQARAYSYAAEDIAAARIEDFVGRDAAQLTGQGGWLGNDIPVPVDNGTATARISDANNCFNINSLVIETDQGLSANPVTIAQFRRLMQLLEIDENAAYAISEAVADWIDSDTSPLPAGAEDAYYRGLVEPYLPPNRLIADASALLAIKGVTPAIYKRLSEYMCALPVAAPSTINANTLLPKRAVLLSMLFENGLPISRAQAYLAKKPEQGYGSLARFWNTPLLAGLKASPAIKAQVSLNSSWFFLRSSVVVGDISLESRALISVQQGSSSIIWRSWGAEG